jgi:hypothetical protein
MKGICSENHTKPVNTLCGQNAELSWLFIQRITHETEKEIIRAKLYNIYRAEVLYFAFSFRRLG